MSNHYHIVIRISQEKVKDWSDVEVAERWLQIFNGPVLVHRFLSGDKLSTQERAHVSDLLETWRERLCSIFENFQIHNAIIVSEEALLPVVSTLCDVLRNVW